MNANDFNAIKERDAAMVNPPSAARAVIICERNGHPIHPDDLGPESAALFKRYCEALGLAVKDRMDLLKMIEDFDTEEYFSDEGATP